MDSAAPGSDLRLDVGKCVGVWPRKSRSCLKRGSASGNLSLLFTAQLSGMT